MDRTKGPLVSCLCVTERRSAFMPWLLWCYDRQQSWPHRELVIVDSSPEPFQISDRDDIRVIEVPFGTGIAKKRNLAIESAQGQIITWFDDDDWQHPDKLLWLADSLRDKNVYSGSCKGWFVDLMTMCYTPYRTSTNQIIFNSGGFRKEAIKNIKFHEKHRMASDTPWINEVAKHFKNNAVVLEHDVMFFWLCHDSNISNPASRRYCSESLDILKRRIGSRAWGDTDNALEELRLRLNGKRAYKVNRPNHESVKVISDKNKNNKALKHRSDKVNTNLPSVSVMIKATVLDAPYLDVMVRHMISQARYDFVERKIIVERNLNFKGKYSNRPKATDDELNRVLEKLISDGIVTHVVDVDMESKKVRHVMEQYFGKEARTVPTHASTGGPIYTTLFGIESMCTDYVLQMDSDVFFYTSGVSWVEEALQHMTGDPQLWLMMTHPGPPAGQSGKSLGQRNERRAQWDSAHRIWRFSTATTRYFLCDRRKLHKRLRPVHKGNGCAPLEQCISAALKRHKAYRGALGNLKSWHLHAWYHGEPFPQWSPLLAHVIEAGKYPSLQKGRYDLRLDINLDRLQWQKILHSGNEDSQDSNELILNNVSVNRQGTSQKAAPLSTQSSDVITADCSDKTEVYDQGSEVRKEHIVSHTTVSDSSALSVIIPVRDRAGQRLKNALSSLNWQLSGRPQQIIVVSHGSQPVINRELSHICSDYGASLITVGDSTDPWNKPFALNVGIRSSSPEIPFIMTMDADIILAPNFFSVLLERLLTDPPALILCRSSDLPQHLSLPNNQERLKNEFARFSKWAKLRASTGTGGIQAAHRSFFFDIRGYDEELIWWGAMDGDMVNRARLAHLKIEWIEKKTAMLHQWHPRKHAGLNNPLIIKQAKDAWRKNHTLSRSRSKVLIRNTIGWGAVSDKNV